jgi:hypothetical protein
LSPVAIDLLCGRGLPPVAQLFEQSTSVIASHTEVDLLAHTTSVVSREGGAVEVLAEGGREGLHVGCSSDALVTSLSLRHTGAAGGLAVDAALDCILVQEEKESHTREEGVLVGMSGVQCEMSGVQCVRAGCVRVGCVRAGCVRAGCVRSELVVDTKMVPPAETKMVAPATETKMVAR